MALDGLREERNLMFELFQPLVDLVGGEVAGASQSGDVLCSFDGDAKRRRYRVVSGCQGCGQPGESGDGRRGASASRLADSAAVCCRLVLSH